jgi:uncharacterized protein
VRDNDKLMSDQIHVRLYEELNDYLPVSRRKRRFNYTSNGITTVNELLRALGVPCAEVEIVLVNGDSVEFSHILHAGDFVGIYPVFESLDVSSLVRVRSKTLRRTRFLIESDLAGLGLHLRELGFDVLDSDMWPLEQRIRICEHERRIFLTKDPDLLNAGFSRIYVVCADTSKHQLLEVLARLDITYRLR